MPVSPPQAVSSGVIRLKDKMASNRWNLCGRRDFSQERGTEQARMGVPVTMVGFLIK
jgi:hypothetical protein